MDERDLKPEVRDQRSKTDLTLDIKSLISFVPHPSEAVFRLPSVFLKPPNRNPKPVNRLPRNAQPVYRSAASLIGLAFKYSSLFNPLI
jgi:hypothetical protein